MRRVEESIELSLRNKLNRAGKLVATQVNLVNGILDLISGENLYEIKDKLSRLKLFQALGQIIIYGFELGIIKPLQFEKERELVILGREVPAAPNLVEIIRALGVKVTYFEQEFVELPELKRQKKMNKILTGEDLLAIFRHPSVRYSNLEFFVFLLVVLFSGVPINQILALRYDQIKDGHIELVVNEKKCEYCVPGDLCRFLNGFRDRIFFKHRVFVFPSKQKEGHRKSPFLTNFKFIKERTQVQISPRILANTLTSFWTQEGVSRQVRNIVLNRHSQIAPKVSLQEKKDIYNNHLPTAFKDLMSYIDTENIHGFRTICRRERDREPEESKQKIKHEWSRAD